MGQTQSVSLPLHLRPRDRLNGGIHPRHYQMAPTSLSLSTKLPGQRLLHGPLRSTLLSSPDFPFRARCHGGGLLAAGSSGWVPTPCRHHTKAPSSSSSGCDHGPLDCSRTQHAAALPKVSSNTIISARSSSCPSRWPHNESCLRCVRGRSVRGPRPGAGRDGGRHSHRLSCSSSCAPSRCFRRSRELPAIPCAMCCSRSHPGRRCIRQDFSRSTAEDTAGPFR